MVPRKKHVNQERKLLYSGLIMANKFTRDSAWRFGGPNTKKFLKVKGKLVIDTTAKGGKSTSDLPASMFGLSKIIDSSPAMRNGEDGMYVTSPDYTGNSLLVKNPETVATADLPNDTYVITLTGY